VNTHDAASRAGRPDRGNIDAGEAVIIPLSNRHRKEERRLGRVGLKIKIERKKGFFLRMVDKL
jgi:hypothetical protein